MSDQLSLLVEPDRGERPRCRMCVRPAWWLQRAQAWDIYCGSGKCTNRERLCQSCGAPFHVGVDGAGTKYCSQACKFNGYGIGARRSPSVGTARCAWCDTPSTSWRRVQGKWPYICAPCVEPIRHLVQRLKDHNVSPERARHLLSHPGCEICGQDVVEKRRIPKTGKVVSLLVIDHDHACCPGMNSCGQCVRGFICGNCNAAIGHLGDSPDSARSAAAYLDRWTGAS